MSLDLTQFVHHLFQLDTLIKIYKNEFRSIRDVAQWPIMSEPMLLLDKSMIRWHGRPRLSRIRNEMDWIEHRDEGLRCGLCRQLGHNRATCPSNVP